MRLIPPSVVAAFLALPSIALAQATTPSQPAAASPEAPKAAPAVTAGLPVMDKDGKKIGKVSKVETDASGKTMATIRMGADSFGVPASAIAVDNGAAKLGYSKAQLDARINGE